MYTEEIILAQNDNIDLDKLKIAILNQDEKSCIESYVDTTRHIQEIEQLFRVFKCNLKLMLEHYVLNNDDTVIRKKSFSFEESDSIIINTLTINYLSSAKTLVESLENFLKINNRLLYENFKNECLSKTYDEKFSYRLLIRLRDFSQHGHLPIDVDCDGKYCFDLRKILLVPHFNHNKKLSSEMEEIEDQILKKYAGFPKIVFTKLIAEFNFCVTKIYVSFFDKAESVLLNQIKSLKMLLKEHPSIIHKSWDSLNGFILYDDDDGIIHCFDPKGESMKMLLSFKDDASKIFKEEEKELKMFNSSMHLSEIGN